MKQDTKTLSALVVAFGVIVYLLLKYNRLKKEGISNPSTRRAVQANYDKSQGLNYERPLRYGEVGNEVVILNEMLSYWDSSLTVTSAFTKHTEAVLNKVREGVFTGDTNLRQVRDIFFSPRFGTIEYNRIIEKYK